MQRVLDIQVNQEEAVKSQAHHCPVVDRAKQAQLKVLEVSVNEFIGVHLYDISGDLDDTDANDSNANLEIV